jgi:hypothetical protein
MLKYVLETLGCSLDSAMIHILGAMFNAFELGGPQAQTFDLKALLGIDISIEEFFYKQKSAQPG